MNPDGDGYQLIITIDGASHVEMFSSLSAMLTRHGEVLSGWRAHGWRDVEPAAVSNAKLRRLG